MFVLSLCLKIAKSLYRVATFQSTITEQLWRERPKGENLALDEITICQALQPSMKAIVKRRVGFSGKSVHKTSSTPSFRRGAVQAKKESFIELYRFI